VERLFYKAQLLHKRKAFSLQNVFNSLRKKFVYGIWNAIIRKFAIISEYYRTDYDSIVLNQETFLERVLNASRNAFRSASGTRSLGRVRNAVWNASGTRPRTRLKRVLERVLERFRNAFFIRLLLSSAGAVKVTTNGYV
jgi:hypothetical protein